MTLCLHRGAEHVDFTTLREVPVPESTKSHVPIPHARFVDLVKSTLGYFGHEVTGEEHGVTEDGMRYFGLLQLKSPYHDYCDVVGLRNSNDKSFPAAVSYGSTAFICDNLAFIGDNIVNRRHTAKLLRDLPGLIMEMVEPLATARERQQRVIQLYKETDINLVQADHIVMESFRQGVINVQRIAEVQNEWENPSYEDFQPRTAWSLFNAFTHVLQGRVAEKPVTTQRLHTIIDGVCEEVGRG